MQKAPGKMSGAASLLAGRHLLTACSCACHATAQATQPERNCCRQLTPIFFVSSLWPCCLLGMSVMSRSAPWGRPESSARASSSLLSSGSVSSVFHYCLLFMIILVVPAACVVLLRSHVWLPGRPAGTARASNACTSATARVRCTACQPLRPPWATSTAAAAAAVGTAPPAALCGVL